jgi:addiction module RelE/StbE family toxin
MSKYEVVFTEDAVDDLDKIKKFYAKQITKRIDTVLLQRAEDVARSGVKKLRGFEKLYRLRVGDYRVFYQVQSNVSLRQACVGPYFPLGNANQRVTI